MACRYKDGAGSLTGEMPTEKTSQRKTPARPLRAAIHLMTEFQSISMLKPTEGDGYTFDLSSKGCRVESDTRLEVGTFLCIHLKLADHEGTQVFIPVARVRWAADTMFGIEFLKWAGRDQFRLERFVWETSAR